jgi:ATP-binding cassette, subfamily C, bacterial CydC
MQDLQFFLKLFLVHWAWLAGGIVLALTTVLAGIGLLALSGWFITAAAVAGLLAPDGIAVTFNFLQPAAEIRALAITRTLGRYAERVLTHEATFRVLARVRVWFFARIERLSAGQISGIRGGELLSRITADIDALDALYLRLLAPLCVAVVGVSAVILFLAVYAPIISVMTAIMMLLAAVLIPLIFNRLGRLPAKHTVNLMAKLRTSSIDLMQGLAELKAYQADSEMQSKLDGLSDQLLESQRKNNHLTGIATALTGFVAHLTVMFTFYFAALLLQEQQINGAILAMLVFCILTAFELVMPLPQAWQMLGGTQQAARRIREMAEMPRLLPEPEHAQSLPEGNDLGLEHVSFRYFTQQRWVLQDINLQLPQGSRIAIIGDSGVGKTTLLQLLTRALDPTQGRILFSEIDYRQLRTDTLLSRFAVLSQRSQLLASSIRENILLAKPDASEHQLAEAIKAAGLQNFVRCLPDGLQTWVGEHGLQVSGGEARRIALARVYLKDAPILLLDEPTEGLDVETERDVLAALQDFTVNKTLVMVTHRSVGLSLVEQVFKLDDGRLYRKT